MYAIILTGGKQVKAEVGQVIYTEKIDGEKDGKVCFDKVLYVEGDKTLVGQPFVAGAKVNATIVKQGKEKKIHVLRGRFSYHQIALFHIFSSYHHLFLLLQRFISIYKCIFYSSLIRQRLQT